MGAADPSDRELAADVVHLVGGLHGFEGFFLLARPTEYRGLVVLRDDMERVRAAARLTALEGTRVLIASEARMNDVRRIEPTAEELAAAAARDEKRRAAWQTYCLDVDVRVTEWSRRARSVLIVSTEAKSVADVLRTSAGTPLVTFGMADVDRVLDVLAVYLLPQVIVLDTALPGAVELESRLRATYPSRYGAFMRIQWFSSGRGLRPEDTERILGALGTTCRPSVATAAGPFSGLSILVIDASDGGLAREVATAAVGATVEHAEGWEALDRIDTGDLDVVVAGEPEEVSLSSLARFVQRAAPDTRLLVAMDAPKSERMGSAHPKLARFFLARPVSTDDLLRAIRAKFES